MTLHSLRKLAAALWLCVVFTYFVQGLTAAIVMIVASSLLLMCLGANKYRVQKRGFLFAFTGVTIADIFIPEIYSTIQPNDSPELTAFVQSGAVAMNPVLQAAAMSGTKKVEVPLWNDLDATAEPNYSDDTDDAAYGDNVTTTSLDARNAYMNKAYGTADLAAEIGNSTPGQGDPMTRIRNRFGTYWARQFQHRNIAVAKGVLASNLANDAGDMVFSVAQETTVGLSASNLANPDAIIEATFTLGDHFENIRCIGMHSVVYKRLLEQELITFLQPSTATDMKIPTYLGKLVIVDDGMPVRAGVTSGLVYTTVLFGAGCIGYGEGTPKVPVELYRRPFGGNGGGLEDLYERKTWMIHPAGFNWTEAAVAGNSPTLVELANPANWTRVFPRKNVPMAFMLTNG
jgi:hypothetical protein